MQLAPIMPNAMPTPFPQVSSCDASRADDEDEGGDDKGRSWAARALGKLAASRKALATFPILIGCQDERELIKVLKRVNAQEGTARALMYAI